MAKASRKLPARTGNIIHAGASFKSAGNLTDHVAQVHNSGARLVGEGGLAVDARRFRWTDVTDHGRPTSKDKILDQARRRLETDDNVPNLKKQFELQIHKWLIEQRALDPELPAMSFGRVQKAIRADKEISALWRARRSPR